MRTTPDALMLFAAGFGTRMGALTANRPKPLIPVAGKVLLDHALDLTRAAGIARVVANVHYLGDQVVRHLAGRDVMISDETNDILETGGGLRKALPLLGHGPVFTLNTDAVWSGPNVVSTLRGQWDGARMSALLALIPAEKAVGHRGTGDFALDAEGRITRGGPYVYTGAQILNPAGIETISGAAFSLNLLWDRMIAEGRAFGVVHRGGWCDVGRPESIPLAEAMLEQADG
ncbi:nucleotidyltransferase family protein [Sinirhodobacter sp. WL0062]|uniref:Nucleotidyltransferase family protein n=1 Tax=Rhodobacter flavimaris TaxID=2907145 RepID=A0ABS8YY56_9RHOB|nr:nucleotidyltransferase family protein [Sinirhodobacter sp. WL0062]MCE5974085.1 nucleotidyltransferase family protein [Sinirhodobacter sp. WL0062]